MNLQIKYYSAVPVPVGSRPVVHRVFAEAKNINGLAALFIKSRQEILSRGPRSIPPCIHCVRRYKPQCHGVQTATNTQQQSTYFLCARCVQKRLKAHFFLSNHNSTTFHCFTVPFSNPTHNLFPLGEYFTAFNVSSFPKLWQDNILDDSNLVMSQMRTVPSTPAEATKLPSTENDNEVTFPLWPNNEHINAPVSESH